MIIRVEIENFLSFEEKATFSTLANRKRTSLAEHCTVLDSRRSALKMAAFYGANGAGKSNVFKAVGFLKRLLTQKYLPQAKEFERIRYALKADIDAPLRLAIEFKTQEGTVYSYAVAIDEAGILEESLKLSSNAVAVFERTRSTLSFAQEPLAAIREIVLQWTRKNPFASLVTVNNDLPILADARLAEVRRYFEEDLVLVGLKAMAPTLIARFRDEPALNAFGNALFASLDLGVNALRAKTKTFDATLVGATEPEFARAYSIENGVRKVTELLFEQVGRGGWTREMDIRAQSDGSVRLLSLLPALYDACEGGKTVLIDEIDASLHPNLVRELVRFYSMRATNGQLLFTTHQTSLLDQSFLRNDEVWLVEKDEGTSRLTSLDTFRIHHTIDIERGYRLGHYGAVPTFSLLNFQWTAQASVAANVLSKKRSYS